MIEIGSYWRTNTAWGIRIFVVVKYETYVTIKVLSEKYGETAVLPELYVLRYFEPLTPLEVELL